MTHPLHGVTATQIQCFHDALYQACGIPSLPLAPSDQRLWWDFLMEMGPLREHDNGPLCVTDIEQVVRHMQGEKREGRAGWSLRPSRILRDPETFRDLVLITREERRKRRVKKISPFNAEAQREEPEETKETKEEAYAAFQAERSRLGL